MTLVFNASPVIVLAKARLLESILPVADSTGIPQAVVDEILQVDDANDPAKCWFEAFGTSVQRVANPVIPPFLAAWDLGAGESAVIAAASAIPDSVAVLDDQAGRRCAQAHGIPMIGTLGLLLLAKKQGILRSVAEPIRAVRAAGLYVSDAIAAEIRAKAGE